MACQMKGSRSTGSRSIAFIRKIQMKTVRASGATSLRLWALWTMPLAWDSTISTRISTAAWKRPGTPEVAARAAFHSSRQPITPSTTEKKIESQCTTLMSNGALECLLLRKVRW